MKEWVEFWGVEFSPGLKTMHSRKGLCDKAGALGYVPNGYDVVACFTSREKARYCYGLLRMNGHKSRVVKIDVWHTNLERKDKFWYEKGK